MLEPWERILTALKSSVLTNGQLREQRVRVWTSCAVECVRLPVARDNDERGKRGTTAMTAIAAIAVMMVTAEDDSNERDDSSDEGR